jgi:ribosomal protein S27E
MSSSLRKVTTARESRRTHTRILDKWRAEASPKGWDAVEWAGVGRAKYRHRQKADGSQCGHMQVIPAAEIRKRRNIRCRGCENPALVWRAIGDSRGWDFIEKIDGQHSRFRHRNKADGSPCWHEQVIYIYGMLHSNVRCRGCNSPVPKWRVEGARSGWDFVEKHKNGYARWRHRMKPDGSRCGHVQIAQMTHMRNDHVRCEKCESPLIKLRREARDKGWELVEQVDRLHARYRHLKRVDGSPCGHEQIFHFQHMRRYNVRCRGRCRREKCASEQPIDKLHA